MEDRDVQELLIKAQRKHFTYYKGYSFSYDNVVSPDPDKSLAYGIYRGIVVVPSDLFIILAVYTCGMATTYSTDAVLRLMRAENPEKYIPYNDSEGALFQRMTVLARVGLLVKVKLVENEIKEEYKNVRTLYAFTAPKTAVNIAYSYLEIPKDISANRIFILNPRQQARWMAVADFISVVFTSGSVRHFSRDYYFYIQDGTRKKRMENPFLWFSAESSDRKIEYLVYPVVLTPEPSMTNEHEDAINLNGVFIMFRRWINYCEEKGKIGRIILIADHVNDLGNVAKIVRDKIDAEHYDKFAITSAALLVAYQDNAPYFDCVGKRITDGGIYPFIE